MPQPPVQKNQVVELEIEDLAYGGMGVSRIGGYVVFVKDAIPGDRAKVRIVKRKGSYSQAAIEELIQPSKMRIEPPCPLHDGCGGCVWQNLPYEEQLKAKEEHIKDSLQRIGGHSDIPLESIVPSPGQFRYRNKMDFSFGADENGKTVLGFHRPGRFDKIFSVPQCLLQPEPLDGVLQTVSSWAEASGLPPYNPKSHEGILRSLILRRSQTNGRWLAVLLTKTTEVGDCLSELASRLEQSADGFAGLIWGFNDGVADIARMDTEAGRVGEPFLEEQLDEFRYRVSPFSFFQTNTEAATLLYRTSREFSGFTGRETLLDAYCGAGTIGIFCARECRKVFGVEIVREAIWDARENAAMNGLDNCTFIAAPMAKGLSLISDAAGSRTDRVIVDPPRGGMDKRSLKQLLAIQAPVFVYISCNPTTMARDVVTIGEAGYRIARARALDLFPHTYHVETVIRFERE